MQKVTFHPTDDPMGGVIERWVGQEFPTLSSGDPEDLMVAIMAELVATKQWRLGPKPAPEALVKMRSSVRKLIAAGEPIAVLMPSAAVKLPIGEFIDVAELSALRALGCLNERVKRHYAPGIRVNIRMEDLTEQTISTDVPNIGVLTSQYIIAFRRIIHAMGYSGWLHAIPESYLASPEEWMKDVEQTTYLFHEFLLSTSHRPEWEPPLDHPLIEAGWYGGVPAVLRQYLSDRYSHIYPEIPADEHPAMMARYLASILTRRRLNASGAPAGPHVQLSFAAPLPGTPIDTPRVYYRTAPRSSTSFHLPFWAAKGYLHIKDDEPVIKLAPAGTQELPDAQFTPGSITIHGEDGNDTVIEADYVLED